MDALPEFALVRATTLDDVIRARANHPASSLLGGGTDLVVNIRRGIVESNDPHGPLGAKEAGEGSFAAFLPALTNAIADAIGVRFNALPVTPDRVFAALEKRRRAGNGSGGKTTGAES